ncbi:hypothetical protein Cyast_1483 [Cyanobacterium stanieri PCC 7202]|uniref:Uncharacterized protein n=1 Tax=Cyanobacterium stanieri (strain ATCC 29140 / PCC 7202) TaxID=292563 RepID=K9YKH2_CYASC|nr:hypothetical protein Cyast_1483 [Cyanobacterium stanieri PCC 7202]
MNTSRNIIKLLTISSLVIIPAQAVKAMPECYVIDTMGKIVNLGFMCNIQITTNERPTPATNQTPPPSQPVNGVEIPQSIPENNQLITPTPPPSNTSTPPTNNRGTVPTF